MKYITRLLLVNISFFSYRAYKVRKPLSAIDWNYHVNLRQAKIISREEVVTTKCNPRTRQWDVMVVKVAKANEYIPVLMSRILNRMADDAYSVTRTASLNKTYPAFISATIAHIPPPSTKEIIQRRSRFTKD